MTLAELPHAAEFGMDPLEQRDLVVLSSRVSLDRQVIAIFYGALVELARTIEMIRETSWHPGIWG